MEGLLLLRSRYAAEESVDNAAVRVCGKELKPDMRGCWLRPSPLFTVVQSLVFIVALLPVSANYTVKAIGMIVVMTGWLSKAFRAVFLKVRFATGHNIGEFVLLDTCSRRLV